MIDKQSISETKPDTDVRQPWQRLDWLLLLAIVALGAALRFWQLGTNPAGFQFDEAFNAIDAEQVLAGNHPLFLPANGGREVLYTYFQAGLIWLFGSSVWSFRLASALWGTAAVAATFVLFRLILKRDSRLLAAFGATALAISYWHIHFSHFGIRVITMPVIFSALFGCFWAGVNGSTRARRLTGFLLAGVLLGASVWSNPTGRLAPAVLIAWVVVLLWRHPEMRRWRLDSALGGLLVTGAVAFLVFLPLGFTFWQHPEFFFGHASEVSVFAERVSGAGGPLAALAQNVLHVLGMFSFFGDLEWTHGIAGRPVLDWIIAIPFYMGIVIWALRLFGRQRKRDPDGDALWLLLLWVIVMLAPSVLSEAAPNYSRTLPALPAVLLPIPLGLAWIVRRPWHASPSRVSWAGYALAGVILCGSLAWTAWDYFVRFPQMEAVYYAWDEDKADALAALQARNIDHQVYLSPLWAEHAPVRWARGGSGIKTLNPAETLVLPADEGAVYAYTGEERGAAEALAARLNEMTGSAAAPVVVEEVKDKFDKALLWLVTLEGDALVAIHNGDMATEQPQTSPPLPETSVDTTSDDTMWRFDDAPAIVGAEMDAQGGAQFEWRAEAPTFRDLTAFVHYIDRDGNRVAQADRIPGDGSYRTPSWSAGDSVFDTLQPGEFAPCSSGEDVRVVAGWYEYAADGARRPRLDAPGDSAVVGEFTLPMRALNEDEVAPEVWLDSTTNLGPLTILGYTMHQTGSMHPGSPFAMDIYYRADHATAPLAAALQYATVDILLQYGETNLPARPLEVDQDTTNIYCQRLRFEIPATLKTASGESIGPLAGEFGTQLAVALPDLATSSAHTVLSDALALLTIDADPARGTLPTGAPSVEATFEAEILLQGAEIGAPLDGTLPVTLTWQALSVPAYPYVAFVQLLDRQERYVAGSDIQPELPTQWWTPGRAYTTLHQLSLPDDLPPGDYNLVGGIYDPLTLQRLTGEDASGVPLPDSLAELGAVTLGR